ncbi:MAG TPA: amidohydrolase family protein [Bryobacteraceae bacterium]|nr:amidohydrolase family protein [Bryobacteraceae bacterium]
MTLLKPIKIDAHQHFWKYSPEEYGWIDDSMKTLRRDFLPGDLHKEIGAAGIDGVISVQARQTLEETKWLLDLAEQNEFIRGIVGWVPLIAPNVSDTLAPMAGHLKLKAVRHVLQGETDDLYMLGEDFNRGIRSLRQFGLAYDVLIFERHLPQTIQFVDRHPAQVFIVDHVAKPRIRERVLSPWRENIRELAKRPHVYCKISGMVTEADFQTWTEQDLRLYLETVLEAFGPKRLMFGSDWPVCLVASGYGTWFELVSRFLASCAEAERDQILGGTAIEAYKL